MPDPRYVVLETLQGAVKVLGRRYRSTRPLLLPDNFAWLAALEAGASAIEVEARQWFRQFAAIDTNVLNPLSVGVTGSWRLVPLVDRTGPYPYLRAMPATQAALSQVPGLRAADFAVLTAGSRITPHVGNNWGVLRAHLALVVPPGEGACALRFPRHRSEVAWSTGEAFIFDDSFEHDAVNDRAGDRVVLLVEADRPLPGLIAMLNRLCQRWYRNHPVQRGVRDRALAVYGRVNR